jgi:hypothetical protein
MPKTRILAWITDSGAWSSHRYTGTHSSQPGKGFSPEQNSAWWELGDEEEENGMWWTEGAGMGSFFYMGKSKT